MWVGALEPWSPGYPGSRNLLPGRANLNGPHFREMHFPHSFGKWISRMDFPDVTLASEDGQQEEAHRLVLASASQKLNTAVRGM